MSTVKDRPIKRRIEILVGRYTANPLMRAMFRLGITPPGMALIETVGNRSGLTRHTPVSCSAEGETLWLIAQHGAHAGWVRNFQAQPDVRIRLGRRWHTGTAELMPDDDVRARIDSFSQNPIARFINRLTFRALESQPVVVRVALSP
jgi:deazaflavin-dependent oxidoreductase (nitroreductase family)